MDTFTKEQRSACMSRIRSENTIPEIRVRHALTKMGVCYRLHNAKLPGKPDIVIKKRNLVIFINGCFWHQHEGCKHSVLPKTNIDYWHKKLINNVSKQSKDIKDLKSMGWEVKIIWECETKKEDILDLIVRELINEKK